MKTTTGRDPAPRRLRPWNPLLLLFPAFVWAVGLIIVAVGKETQMPGWHSVWEINFWAWLAIYVFYPCLALGVLLLWASAAWALARCRPEQRRLWNAGVAVVGLLLLAAASVSLVL